MPDPIFDDPRLAVVADLLDDDRSDPDAYVAIVEELDVTSESTIRFRDRHEVVFAQSAELTSP